MSCCKDVQLGAVGVVFELELVDCNGSPVDISEATGLEMLFRSPRGTLLTKTATMTVPGTLGKITYTTVDGDLSVAGRWSRQARVTWPDGKSIPSGTAFFNVLPNV